VALPQETSRPEVSSIIPAVSTPEMSMVEDDRNCGFDTIEDFFNYANKNSLNITAEVQNCQNLCLLTYGVGNPDLSGIGVSYSTAFILHQFVLSCRHGAVANRLAFHFAADDVCL
jgi:hypothetical protein